MKLFALALIVLSNPILLTSTAPVPNAGATTLVTGELISPVELVSISPVQPLAPRQSGANGSGSTSTSAMGNLLFGGAAAAADDGNSTSSTSTSSCGLLACTSGSSAAGPNGTSSSSSSSGSLISVGTRAVARKIKAVKLRW